MFLQKFMGHGNAQLKYYTADKGFLETVLDMEFQVIQENDPCIFYRDKSGEALSSLLFYGSELTLIIFETLTFLTFDLAFSPVYTGSYFIAAAITFLVYCGVALARKTLGERNICQKTLIDERFMI